jgi:hypothetical protein
MPAQGPSDHFTLEGRRISGLSREAAQSLARQGVVAYSVVVEERREARAQTRARTRLRSAKVIDANNAFLCEALVHDRSPDGMRLLLARNVGLPSRFGVFDDENGELVTATLAWRRGHTIGLRIARRGPPTPMTPAQKRALGGRYYGMGA